RLWGPEPLQVGLGPEREALVEVLRQQTGAAARILWEDRPRTREAAHWEALLPLLTDRAFLGGLDPEGGIEHTGAGLVEQTLAGRPLAQWSDAALSEYCQRYNIGWVVCWSPAAMARFQSWPGCVAVAEVHDAGSGWLFQVNRRRSYALKGQA